MKLHEIVKEKSELHQKHGNLKREYDIEISKINNRIKELERIESAAMNDLNIDYIQIAESILRVYGNPYGITDNCESTIAYYAITDIATGCNHLKKEFFGNKRYSGYYQRNDCNYGYGPSHGSTVDYIGLKDDARKRDLTGEEKDACIYYLRNYKKIKELTVS